MFFMSKVQDLMNSADVSNNINRPKDIAIVGKEENINSKNLPFHPHVQMSIDRLDNATVLSERKKAMESIKSLLKKYKDDIGKGGMSILLNTLVSDPRDTEFIEATLEVVHDLIHDHKTNANILLGDNNHVKVLLTLVEDTSAWIRGPAVNLLKVVQDSNPELFASSIVQCNEGLRRLMDILEDKRDHIRYSLIQLLLKLTDGNKDVQQFMAFEDGFGRLFHIMGLEGFKDGSSLVADGLQITSNLLDNNYMTQMLFKDGPFIQDLSQVLSLEGIKSNNEIGEHKIRSMILSLNILNQLLLEDTRRLQCMGTNELLKDEMRKIEEMQKYLGGFPDLLNSICILSITSYPCLSQVQIESLSTLYLICEKHVSNQNKVLNMMVSNSNKMMLSELIQLELFTYPPNNEFSFASLSAEKLLNCLLNHDNEMGKMTLIQHIHTPPPPNIPNGEPIITGGIILLNSLTNSIEECLSTFSIPKKDLLMKCWKSCQRFQSIIKNSLDCKELALRIPLAYNVETTCSIGGTSYLTKIIRWLSQAYRTDKDILLHVGLYRLLSTWINQCPKAIREMVQSLSNLNFLFEILSCNQSKEISFNSNDWIQIQGLAAMILSQILICLTFVEKIKEEEQEYGLNSHQILKLLNDRVGLEHFTDVMIQIQSSSSFLSILRTDRRRQSDLFPPDLYDKEFIRNYKEINEQVQKIIIHLYTTQGNSSISSSIGSETTNSSNTHGQEDNTVSAYQDLIRVQDKELQTLRKEMETLKLKLPNSNEEKNEMEKIKEEGKKEMDQLNKKYKDEIDELKKKIENYKEKSEISQNKVIALENRMKEIVKSISLEEEKYTGLQLNYNELEKEFHQQEKLIQELKNQSSYSSTLNNEQNHIDNFKSIQQQLLIANKKIDEMNHIIKGYENMKEKNEQVIKECLKYKQEIENLKTNLQETQKLLLNSKSIQNDQYQQLCLKDEKINKILKEAQDGLNTIETRVKKEKLQEEKNNEIMNELRNQLNLSENKRKEMDVLFQSLTMKNEELQEKIQQSQEKLQSISHLGDEKSFISSSTTSQETELLNELESQHRDLLLLLGNQEILCVAFRDKLEQMNGPEAVKEALFLSRQMGAIDTV